ncbi:hypothetical protein KC640_02515, partial [Candidatus Dojkabacteria bacterium]|nr:hypothetical protein [Candidatus Dojkabacteria bacterium]
AQVIILAPVNPGANDLSKINANLAAAGEPKGAVLVERFTSTEEYVMVDKQNLMEKIERVMQNRDKPVITFDDLATDARRSAIQLALKLARPGDIVLLSGKGTDNLMDFGNVKYDWNEVEMVRRALRGDGVISQLA